MSVTPLEPSAWALDRFGSAAAPLLHAVPEAVHQAHALAEAAHLASGLNSNDTYGYTLHVTLHEQLVQFTSNIPGVTARKPIGVRSRFPYVVVEETSVALMPWRFAAAGSVRRTEAKLPLPVSDLRRTMFGLSMHQGHIQPTLQDTDLDIDELEAMISEEREMFDQFRRRGTVVTIGLASNPTNGILTLGWGDVELVDADSGEVTWRHWEALRTIPVDQLGARPILLRPAETASAARFDDAPLDDAFRLVHRTPLASEPISEHPAEEQATGTGADDDGRPGR